MLYSAKGKVHDPQKVIDELKKKVNLVCNNAPYIQHNYLKCTVTDFEFVSGVWFSYGNEILKTVERKGGLIKVWSIGPQIDSTKNAEISLLRPSVKDNPVARTMLHKDKSLNQLLSHMETSFEYKSIFPESHPVAKLSLLNFLEEDEKGHFEFNRLFDIVKEELHYLEDDEIKKHTEDILKIATEIGFIEQVQDKNRTYKIIARTKKRDSRQEELMRKWIDFKIEKEKEAEKDQELIIIQNEFKKERLERKTITDYSQ
jgi:hypothetical protein